MKIFSKNLACLLATVATVAAQAGDMYKWQDEDGIWHYSDRAPAPGQAFETFEVAAEPHKMVSMRQGGLKHKPSYHFFNHYHGPAELEVSLTDGMNVKTEPPLPARVVLPAQTEKQVVTFEANDPYQAFRYRLAYIMVPGPPVERLPEDVDFYPPFPAGMEFPISQGIDELTTHDMEGNQYAVDITMPTGTPVLAARTGVVMDLEDDFHGGGKQEERFLKRANYVRILHDDGSMGVYAHLQPGSAQVYPGARVPAGTWIANSGNTGYSSGPHLHFVIQLNVGMAIESLPFRFRQRNGRSITPDGHVVLRGVLPKS